MNGPLEKCLTHDVLMQSRGIACKFGKVDTYENNYFEFTVTGFTVREFTVEGLLSKIGNSNWYKVCPSLR